MPLFDFYGENIFVVRAIYQCYNFSAGVGRMSIKSIEQAIYSNEEFLKELYIFKKDNWKKAKVSERIGIFKKIHEAVCNAAQQVPEKFVCVDFSDLDVKQDVIIGEKGVVFNKKMFTQTFSPYHIFYTYVFELGLENNIAKANAEGAKNDKNNRKFFLNNSCSIFDNWDNYYEREHSEFLYQPLTNESYKTAIKILYKFICYMHATYGMDDYIGSELANIMLDSFKKEKVDLRVAKNYKKMEEQYKTLDEEIKKQDELFDFLDDHPNFEGLEDNDFYFLLNTALVEGYDVGFRLELYREFIRRIFKNDEEAEKFNEYYTLAVTEENQNAVVFGETAYITEVTNELNLIVGRLLYYKVTNGLLDEIEDEDFKLEAMECLQYMDEVRGEDGLVTCKYLSNALAYMECKNYLNNYYYDLIKNSIKNNKIFNYGYPLISRSNFSKYEAYLKFTFDKDYMEVRKEQFASLKKEYEEKKGVKR